MPSQMLVLVACLLAVGPRHTGRAGITATVPVPPGTFTAEGQDHLVYELLVRNDGAEPAEILRVRASGNDERVFGSFEAESLVATVRSAAQLALTPGASARLFLWIAVAPGSAPTALNNVVTVRTGSQTMDVSAAAVIPDRTPLPRLGPPLRGRGWWTGNGPENASGHRRAALSGPNGLAPIAQRFAIDYVQLTAEGRTFVGPEAVNASYLAYGEEVIAVADGIITRVVDGVTENIPNQPPPAAQVTRETAPGNAITLDLGGNRYALYAHLQPGSITVRQGDRVRRGQVLGRVGNSGRSTEPHLHFHVSTDSASLRGEGVPYLLDSFESADPVPGTTPQYRRRLMELPMGKRWIRFAETSKSR